MRALVCLAAAVSIFPIPALAASAGANVPAATVLGAPRHLTLSEAIAIAVAASPSMELARSNIDQAEASLSLARTPMSPSLVGQAGYAGTGGSPGGIVVEQKSSSVSLRQLIYDGGRTLQGARAAQAGVRADTASYQRALQQLSFNVAQAYYNAALAESSVRLQMQIVDQDKHQEQLIAAQIRAGTVAPIDLETAQIPTAQAQVALVEAQGEASAAEAVFAQTLGLPADAPVFPEGESVQLHASTLPPGTTLDYKEAVERSLAERPDYVAALARADAAASNLRAARLSASPTISVDANAGAGSFPFLGWKASSGVGLTATIPLYDQGIRTALKQSAYAQQEATMAQLATVKLEVQSDVRQALVRLIAQQAALEQTSKELSKARDVASATQRLYSAGQTTLPLLLNAQVQLTGAQTDHLVAEYSLRVDEQAYLYALGENDGRT